jgi:hypothetical protein
VKPAEQSHIEARVRSAYAEATATITPADISSDAPARPRSAAGRIGRNGGFQRVVPLTAGLAVVLVVATAVVVPRLLARASPLARPAAAPHYMIYDAVALNELRVFNPATGRQTTRIDVPMKAGYWFSLAAQGPLTFVAGEVVDGPQACFAAQITTYMYRIRLTAHGTVLGIRRIMAPIAGELLGAAITPSGRYLAYALVPPVTHCSAGTRAAQLVTTPATQLVIRNTITGTITAKWTLSEPESVGSFALNPAGTRLVAAIYEYKYGKGSRAVALTQATRILDLATSGRSVSTLPVVSSRAGPVALNPDGKTLYQIVPTGRLTPTSFLDPHPIGFALEAISMRTGKVLAVYHRWTALWSVFDPYLSLDPSGRYLIVVAHESVGKVDTRTGRYTKLPNIAETSIPLALLPLGQDAFDLVAW